VYYVLIARSTGSGKTEGTEVNATPEQETVAEKILKLLAKAESTTAEEAEALLEKAAALQAKYSIDQAMLRMAGKTGGVGVIEKVLTVKGGYAYALQQLALRIGGGKGFKCLIGGRGNYKVVYWIGHADDVADAEVLYTSLLIQQERAAREAMKSFKEDPWSNVTVGSQRYQFKRSFMVGFADGVGEILVRAKKEATKQAEEQHGSDSVALVLVDRKDEIDHFYQDKYAGRVKSHRDRNRVGHGYSGGREAGLNADVGGRAAVGGGAKGQLR
jgi:hypothetical protein